MYNRIVSFALIVRDYDEAINFYTKILNFDLLEDTILSPTKRWVRVAPKGAKECSILLAKAANEKQIQAIGNQTGGRVGFFLHTDDFEREYQQLIKHQVKIVREPSKEAHGIVLVFEDLYGNLWI